MLDARAPSGLKGHPGASERTGGENMSHEPVVRGQLGARPVARLLGELFRRQVTGCLWVKDAAGNESRLYLRQGAPVHLDRPDQVDRLDRVLVDTGLVPAPVIGRLAILPRGKRLGETLVEMGLLNSARLADALKLQMRRKLRRLFVPREGSFAVFIDPHPYGDGCEFGQMRVDPRCLIYPGIRASYDEPRLRSELTPLGSRAFRLLPDLSRSLLEVMAFPEHDPTLRQLSARALTVAHLPPAGASAVPCFAAVLALLYLDLLDTMPVTDIEPPRPRPALPRVTRPAPARSPRASDGTPTSGIRPRGDAESCAREGEELLAKGDHAAAIRCFEAALQATPGEPVYLAYWAWAQWEAGGDTKDQLVRDTLETIEAALHERPTFARGLYWRGMLNKHVGDFVNAENAFRRALLQDKNLLEAEGELRLLEMRRRRAPALQTAPGGVSSRPRKG